MSGDPTNDLTVTFSVDGLDQELHVQGFHGSEGISRLFSFELQLACRSASLDFEQLVGRPGLLTLDRDGQRRHVHGLVTFLEQRRTGRRFTGYQASLRPRAWRLHHCVDCRIFQRKSSKEIVAAVLDAADVTHRFSSRGNKDPAQREYCVQYRESHWDFVSRLLEEEGYFYFFEHTERDHTMVIANYPQAHEEIAGESTLRVGAPGRGAASREHISDLTFSQQVLSGRVTLNDFNFKMPSVDFKNDDQGEANSDLEVYDYPGLYEDPDLGGELSRVRLQELEALRRGGRGQSDCARFVPGYTFTLEGHDRSELNDREYLLTRAQHQGTKAQDLDEGPVSDLLLYSNGFDYMPADTPFRPLRRTPRPRVAGAQTAVVVGPSGEEVYVDEHGRVKVQFHWDRQGGNDEDSSCWIRVSQLWAGEGWGAMFIPRVGQEVVVDFLEGDPDRPLIIGRVYNARNTPPYTLPDDKSKSTVKSNSTLGGGGFNELRFDDRKGAEEVFIHAQRNMNEKVLRNHSTSVGANQSRSVGNDRSASVAKGNDTLKVETGHREVTVQLHSSLTTKAGDRTVDVHGGSNYSLTTHSGDISHTASGKVTVKGNSKGVAIWGYKEGTYIAGTVKGVTVMGRDKGVTLVGEGGKGTSIKGRKGSIGLELAGHGTIGVKLHGNPRIEAKAEDEAKLVAKMIHLKSGPSSIKISPTEIRINSPMVKINCKG